MAAMKTTAEMLTVHTFAVLPDLNTRTPHNALGECFIRQIDVYEDILSHTIPREEIDQMASERIIDKGSSP